MKSTNPNEQVKNIGKFLEKELYSSENVVFYSANPFPNKFFDLKEHNIVAKKVTVIELCGDIVEIEKQNNNFYIPFWGLNTEGLYIDLDFEDKCEEIAQKIMEDMNKKEEEWILKTKRKFPNKQLIFVRRKVSEEIVKLLGGNKDNLHRAIIISPFPVSKENDKTGKLYYRIYGYESVILAVIE